MADLILTLKTELRAYAHTSRHDCWAVASIKAPLFKDETRVPIDVVAVIDVSSSMAGVKLELVKKTLLFVIGQLKECDRFSLVSYNSIACINLGLIKMTPERKAAATSAIQVMSCARGTNLCEGLLTGMKEIAYKSGQEKAKVQSVLLLTDGLANKGVTTKDGILAKMMRIQNPQGEKVAQKKFDGTVYTFGFGADHDAGMLAAISTQGGGVYYFINTEEKIPVSYADCLGGLVSVVGQNLSLKLELQGDNHMYYVHSSGTVNCSPMNNSWDISLGDMQCEEERDIVMNLILPALTSSTITSVLKATLSYFSVIRSSTQTISRNLIVKRTDAAPGATDADLDQQRNRIVAASTLKLAKALADKDSDLFDAHVVLVVQSVQYSYIGALNGNLKDAKSLLNKTIASIGRSVSAQLDFSKALLMDLQTSIESLDSQKKYRSRGEKYMCSKFQTHVAQRSNSVESVKYMYYQNSSKKAFREASKEAFGQPSPSLEPLQVSPPSLEPPQGSVPTPQPHTSIEPPACRGKSAVASVGRLKIIPARSQLPSRASLEPSHGAASLPLQQSHGLAPLPLQPASRDPSHGLAPLPLQPASRDPSHGLPPPPWSSLEPLQGPLPPPTRNASSQEVTPPARPHDKSGPGQANSPNKK